MNWTKERQVVYCIEEVVDKHWMLGRFKVYGVVFRARLFRVDARSDHLVLVYLQHVTEEGTALVKQAEDAVSNKRVSLFRFSADQICSSLLYLPSNVCSIYHHALY